MEIRPTRFHRRQDGDHHVDGPLEKDAHQDIGPHAQGDQLVCQLICARVQLAVRERLATALDRNRLRRRLRLRLKEVIKGRASRIVGGGLNSSR